MSIDVDLLLELQVVLQGALLVLGGRWALPHPQHVRHVRLLLGGLCLLVIIVIIMVMTITWIEQLLRILM